MQKKELFENALIKLAPILKNNSSFKEAVFIVENAFYNDNLSDSLFAQKISLLKVFSASIRKKKTTSYRSIDSSNYLTNAAISQIIYGTFNFIADSLKLIHLPFTYNFSDPFGEQDYTNTFVTKLLATHQGNCQSLAYLYKILADELGAKCWLSLAPEHSFIKFMDAKGKLSNFEATNGHIVSLNWLLQSNAISAVALKNNTYLDTLSSKQLYAQCLGDLLMAYEAKNGYDNFSQQIGSRILAIDPNNIVALMTNANYESIKFRGLAKQYHIQSQQQIEQNPTILNAQQQMLAAQQKVNDLGYQDMPKEQYLQWLQSIEIEKAKREPKIGNPK